jgi:hypothetical protein
MSMAWKLHREWKIPAEALIGRLGRGEESQRRKRAHHTDSD